MKSENKLDLNYLNAHISYNHSILYQEVIRNGQLINIPLHFIVKGDLIKVNPGQTFNLFCQSINKNKVNLKN